MYFTKQTPNILNFQKNHLLLDLHMFLYLLELYLTSHDVKMSSNNKIFLKTFIVCVFIVKICNNINFIQDMQKYAQ